MSKEGMPEKITPESVNLQLEGIFMMFNNTLKEKFESLETRSKLREKLAGQDMNVPELKRNSEYLEQLHRHLEDLYLLIK